MSLRRLVSLLGLFAASVATAEPVVVASGLDHPTAIAVAEGPKGGHRILIAEANQLTQLTVLGQATLQRKKLLALEGSPTVGLAEYGERLLVLSRDGLQPFTEQGPDAEASGLAVIGPPALSDRWLFVPGEDRLLRGRLASGRVTKLRAAGPEGQTIGPLCFSPEGYLVALLADEAASASWRLLFFDPGEPSEPVAQFDLKGLDSPIGLMYAGEHASTLVAIDAGQQAGLYRIAVAGQLAKADILESIEEPIGMAAEPDGALVVATREGQLLRYRRIFQEAPR